MRHPHPPSQAVQGDTRATTRHVSAMQHAGPVKEIVLLGGGHAHVEVLRRQAIRPIPGLRYTLIARERLTPYSGMLPGLIRGDYTHAQAHIDCAALAASAGARLIIAEAEAIDLSKRRVHASMQPPTAFDLLSIDVGGVPRMPLGAAAAVKPISRFLSQLAVLDSDADVPLAVIGGGAGGTELSLALAHRQARRRITLVSGRTPPLANAPSRVKAIVADALKAASITLVQSEAVASPAGTVSLANGTQFPAHALWATGAVAPPFLAASGLACDQAGCIRVDASLRSLSHDFVHAAGDCATLDGNPRPKAGVWAVRAGPALALNLIHAARGETSSAWHPQSSALTILGLGGGRAVAWRGAHILLWGRPAWLWKDHIDRAWMLRYRQLGLSATAAQP